MFEKKETFLLFNRHTDHWTLFDQMRMTRVIVVVV
jgi:hypothetical protein